MGRGVFITFEGIEGTGKSTQVAMLAGSLRGEGRRVVVTREPGGTAIGDRIRGILLDPAHAHLDPVAELLLYGASRAQHLREVIRPALQEGAIVLCDRFSDATLAYQGYGRGLDRQMIVDLDRIATGGMKPDLTVLLDIEPAAGLSRAHRRNRSEGLEAEARFEHEDLAFHGRVHDGYLAIMKDEPGRLRMVDASLTEKKVHAAIREIVGDVLGKASLADER
jgi:dTMP kinase